MQYQTFRGADLKEALGRVKAAFGADAVIESTRQITNGKGGNLGRTVVEVTAGGPSVQPVQWPFSQDVSRATEPTPDPTVETRQHRRPVPRITREIAPYGLANATGQEQRHVPGVSLEIDRELRSLRAMLEELSSSRKPRERALAILHEAGFEGTLARELANGSHRAARQGATALRDWILDRIRARLRIVSGMITSPKRQLIACVGPSGAGKTTTLAKLAARARLEHSRSVGIVSLDTYRVGAVEQWQRYAQLLGIPFNVARGAEDFRLAISTSTSDLVLVDTSGRGMADQGDSWPLIQCLPLVTRHELQVLVVLPAWLRARDAEQVVRTYADSRPTGAVVTKTDETMQQGGVVQAALTNDLPLAYICNGPRVPEDIREATAEIVLKRLLLTDA
ncbi:MAG TPA: flagellar biosynthesis protein FlhF [Polyangiaceae bacterium]